MVARKLDFDMVRDNLQYRHKDGRLVGELEALTVVAEFAPGVRARNNAQRVLDIALEITGQARPTLDETSVPQAQVKAYCLCEGGFLGRFAAEQPGDFYLDDRTGFGSRARRQIYNAVAQLKALAVKNGLNPKAMPDCPDFHNCGAF